jgi:hypothetical protein
MRDTYYCTIWILILLIPRSTVNKFRIHIVCYAKSGTHYVCVYATSPESHGVCCRSSLDFTGHLYPFFFPRTLLATGQALSYRMEIVHDAALLSVGDGHFGGTA